MQSEIDAYIDRMGGDWTLDYQYFREVAKIFSQDICAVRPYHQTAEKFGTTYFAVQKGVGRAAEELWKTGKDILLADLNRPKLMYSGPQRLAIWIARAVTKSTQEW